MKNEKLTASRIKSMKKDFGTFKWWDVDKKYTAYASYFCCVITDDAELKERVSEVEPKQSKISPAFNSEVINTMKVLDSGSDGNGWKAITTVGDIRNPKRLEFNAETTRLRDAINKLPDGSVIALDNRDSDVAIKLSEYSNKKEYLIAIRKSNFVEFLKMFSSKVSDEIEVFYNENNLQISLLSKGEYGLMTIIDFTTTEMENKMRDFYHDEIQKANRF